MEAMPIQFRRNSWSCQKASSNHRLLNNLPWAGGASLGALDVPPGCAQRTKMEQKWSSAAFVREKLELIGSGKGVCFGGSFWAILC